jgi:hypothetical protein
MKLSLIPSDYTSILKYYNINTLGMSQLDIKKQAEHILATKMCRCIKTIQKNKTLKNLSVNAVANEEASAIAICKKSVLNNKNLSNFRFTCKKKYKLLPKKSRKNIFLLKTKPKLNLTIKNKIKINRQ